MSDDVEKVVEGLIKRGIGFRPGDVVVIESQVPLSQAAAEVLADYFRDFTSVTGVHFVLLDHDLKVSEVQRNDK